jgi:hypothetical protein
MHAKPVDAVDDVSARDDADGYRKERDRYADGDIPENNLRTRFPNQMEYRRNVLKGPQTIAPRASVLLCRASHFSAETAYVFFAIHGLELRLPFGRRMSSRKSEKYKTLRSGTKAIRVLRRVLGEWLLCFPVNAMRASGGTLFTLIELEEETLIDSLHSRDERMGTIR